MDLLEHGQDATIECKVAKGMFSGERNVFIALPDGRVVGAYVDKSDVIVEREPEEGVEVDGRLRVKVLESRPHELVVDLPRPTMTEGSRLTVPKDMVSA